MVTTLFESGAKRKKPKAGLAASVAIHSVIIAASLAAGGTMAASTLERPKAENIEFVAPKPVPEPKKVYVAPKAKPPAAPKRAAAPRARIAAPRAPSPTAAPAPAPVIDVPVNVAVITTPTVVPTSLPAIDPNALETTGEIVARASDLIGRSGSGGGSGRVTGESGGDVSVGVSRGDGSAWAEAQVDKAVQPLRVDPPRYPDRLRSSGVSGTVVLRFVVGPDGRVEMGTVAVVDSPHDDFTDAVKNTLRKARYRPAEVQGTKVRQLVEQSFTFRLDG